MTLAFSVSSAVKYGNIERIKQWLDADPDPDELGRNLLIAASAPAMSVEVVELLVRAGADPNYTRDVDGFVSGPPLALAAGKSSIQVVKCLVDLGANVNYSAPYGFNAMNGAVYSHTSFISEIVEYLISLGIDLNVESKYGESPLSVASHRGKFGVVRRLLDAGADASRLGWNSLMGAVVFGSLADCRASLRGVRLSHLEDRDRLWERTAFLLGVQVGDTGKTALLLAAGADRYARGRCGKTALMHAAEMNHVAMIEWLISRGAAVDEVDEFEETALIVAAEHGAADSVRALLKAGADINRLTHTENSAIDQSSNIEAALVLRDAGADINRIAGDGYNLLKAAADRGDLKFTQQLLAAGADPNRTTIGDVPLHIAVQRDDVEIIRALLRCDANPNAQDVDGRTPLFCARSIEATKLLLDAGADPGVTEGLFGQTAMDCVPEELRTFLAARRPKRR